MSRKIARASLWLTGFLLLTALGGSAIWIQTRRATHLPTIAFIPQTSGSMLWEVEHTGALAAAERRKFHIYWNAPTSENDTPGQISLIDRVSRGKYQGLVVAPNHPLGVLVPLRRAVAAGLPVVIVAASLDLPASDKLGYILNDDDKMGEMAATEIARLMQGKGSVALVGVSRYAPGVIRRARAAERVFATRFPNIQVVSRQVAAYNTPRAEELTNDLLDSHPDLSAVLTFSAASTRGVHAAVMSRSPRAAIHLVGCEQDHDLISYLANGEIAAVVAENTYQMGYEAVGLIAEYWAGKPIPARSVIEPILLTKQNLNSAGAAVVTGSNR